MECMVEKCLVSANPVEIPSSTATNHPQFVYPCFTDSARSLCCIRRTTDDISEYGRSLQGCFSFFVCVSVLKQSGMYIIKTSTAPIVWYYSDLKAQCYSRLLVQLTAGYSRTISLSGSQRQRFVFGPRSGCIFTTSLPISFLLLEGHRKRGQTLEYRLSYWNQ